MAGGFGAGAFGAGFAKSLTDVLMNNRQQQAAKKEKEFQALLPIHLQLAAESGDYSGVENLISTYDPELAQTLKKNSPFGRLHELIGPQLKMTGEQALGPSQSQTGAYGLPLPASEPAPPGTPPEQQVPLAAKTVTTEPVPGTTAPPAGSTFFGSPVLTPTQRAEREAEANVNAGKLQIEARRKIAQQMGMTPEKAADYALYGTRPPQEQRVSAEPYQAVEGEDKDGHPIKAVFDQSRGMYLDPITRQPIAGFKPKSATSSSAASEFDQFLASYAKDKNKPVESLSAQERLDARKQYAEAGSTRQATTSNTDPQALARLAIRNPTVLQSLTPTVASGVMTAIASDPVLAGQYEVARMGPIREQAQNALDAMNDLIQVDPKSGKVVGLTPGAAALYGKSSLLGQRFIPGSEAATSRAALDQLTGELVVNLLRDLKAQSRTGATGFGQLSARELDVLQQSATMLKGNISEARAAQELKKLHDKFQAILAPSDVEKAPLPNNATITLDTPVFIDQATGKATLTPPGR